MQKPSHSSNALLFDDESTMPFGLALQGLIDAQLPKHGALEICAVRHDLQGAAAAEAHVRARLQEVYLPLRVHAEVKQTVRAMPQRFVREPRLTVQLRVQLWIDIRRALPLTCRQSDRPLIVLQTGGCDMRVTCSKTLLGSAKELKADQQRH